MYPVSSSPHRLAQELKMCASALQNHYFPHLHSPKCVPHLHQIHHFTYFRTAALVPVPSKIITFLQNNHNLCFENIPCPPLPPSRSETQTLCLFFAESSLYTLSLIWISILYKIITSHIWTHHNVCPAAAKSPLPPRVYWYHPLPPSHSGLQNACRLFTESSFD